MSRVFATVAKDHELCAIGVFTHHGKQRQFYDLPPAEGAVYLQLRALDRWQVGRVARRSEFRQRDKRRELIGRRLKMTLNSCFKSFCVPSRNGLCAWWRCRFLCRRHRAQSARRCRRRRLTLRRLTPNIRQIWTSHPHRHELRSRHQLLRRFLVARFLAMVWPAAKGERGKADVSRNLRAFAGPGSPPSVNMSRGDLTMSQARKRNRSSSSSPSSPGMVTSVMTRS